MNRTRKLLILFVFVSFFLGACTLLEDGNQSPSESVTAVQVRESRSGMGPGSGMMNRHHAQIPDDYVGLTNPISPDSDSLARGEDIYVTHCASCHGDYGNGDGPAGVTFDPAPSPIAHTSQMMGDAYLFWRITEGGLQFETGMIPYRDILDEQERWDVINYVRALGRGQVEPGQHMGGQPFNQDLERENRNEMLQKAIDQGVISRTEADIFNLVHDRMDEYLDSAGIAGMDTGPRSDALPQILAEMVKQEIVVQDQAETFMDVHDRLIEAGLMQ